MLQKVEIPQPQMITSSSLEISHTRDLVVIENILRGIIKDDTYYNLKYKLQHLINTSNGEQNSTTISSQNFVYATLIHLLKLPESAQSRRKLDLCIRAELQKISQETHAKLVAGFVPDITVVGIGPSGLSYVSSLPHNPYKSILLIGRSKLSGIFALRDQHTNSPSHADRAKDLNRLVPNSSCPAWIPTPGEILGNTGTVSGNLLNTLRNLILLQICLSQKNINLYYTNITEVNSNQKADKNILQLTVNNATNLYNIETSELFIATGLGHQKEIEGQSTAFDHQNIITFDTLIRASQSKINNICHNKSVYIIGAGDSAKVAAEKIFRDSKPSNLSFIAGYHAINMLQNPTQDPKKTRYSMLYKHTNTCTFLVGHARIEHDILKVGENKYIPLNDCVIINCSGFQQPLWVENALKFDSVHTIGVTKAQLDIPGIGTTPLAVPTQTTLLTRSRGQIWQIF